MISPILPEELSYEEAVRELEAVIGALETAQISLEESLALYERGQALAARCAALLDKAELRLKTLTPGGEGV
jgi:exodeoxyribonuclease VII small subunit